MPGRANSASGIRADLTGLRAAVWLAGLLSLHGAHAQSTAHSEPARYTVFIQVSPPAAGNRTKLQALLKAEGYPSHAEGETEIALALTEEEIRKLFQARVRHRSVEASASRGTRQQPYLENVTIPGRLRGLMEKAYIDPQRG
jgi:hypothetical protein